ncbi:hypothetical protein HK098_005306 [Nowakowskiella sp. JEL0407]|nr:hypothetical protein HK098_005306 [Nowakowskiella sp. JEL0407]
MSLKLLSGESIPVIGLGVWQAYGKDVVDAVRSALQLGYRHIDTAQLYENEEEVGQGIRESGVPRSEIFVTTKVWMSHFGYDATIEAFNTSLKKLGTGYVDLYLIHSPHHPKLQKGTWKAMEYLHSQGLIRSIGVSNFNVSHLETLSKYITIPISVNQIEVTPYLQRREIVEYCHAKNIVVAAYSPLTQGCKFSDPILIQIGDKYGKSPAQVLIKWGLQKGLVSLPKSSNPTRIEQNMDMQWTIGEQDMATLDSLEEGFVAGWDPTDMKWPSEI